MTKRNVKFGKNLQLLRSINNVSQQQLADEILVTRQAISAWEREAGKPDIYSLHDICEFFKVNVETLMYGNVIETTHAVPRFDVCEDLKILESNSGIRNYKQKGLYTIINEDINDFFGIIEFGFEKIMVLALDLNRRGYKITEVFNNGFSIYLKTDEEAENFHKVLWNTLDDFIHHDNAFIEEKSNEIAEPLYNAYNDILNNVFEQIHGREISDFSFYWVDGEENIRGYANTKEECMEQAMQQECKEYVMLRII